MPSPIVTLTLALGLAAVLSGCTSLTYQGPARDQTRSPVRLFLPPFYNATDDEHAARALTEMTASALLDNRVPLIQTEPALYESRMENAAGADGLFLQTAQKLEATHLLIGTVHEYRYKTDLDGDPVVGITMRLVLAETGETLWQGTAANVDVIFASLSATAARAARNLVEEMPLPRVVNRHPKTPWRWDIDGAHDPDAH